MEIKELHNIYTLQRRYIPLTSDNDPALNFIMQLLTIKSDIAGEVETPLRQSKYRASFQHFLKNKIIETDTLIESENIYSIGIKKL